MSAYPSSLWGIVRTAANSSQRIGIDKAVDEAFSQWSAHDEYESWIEQMVRGELRSLIHDVRHAANVSRKRDNGEYGGPAKVSAATGASNRVASQSLLEYCIAGRTLGDIQGKDIAGLADSEEARGNGCHLNARLLRAIKPLVGEEERVRDAVSESKAKALFKSVNANTNGRSTPKLKPIIAMPGHSSKQARGEATASLVSRIRMPSSGTHKSNGHANKKLPTTLGVRGRRKSTAAV